MARGRFWIWVGIALAAGLCASSGWAAYREFVPFAQSSSAMDAKIQALATAEVVPGLSYRSKLLVLNDCNGALSSLEAATVAPERRAALFSNCGKIADKIISEAPTYSLAYLVQALVAQENDDMAALGIALVRSQESAPFQEWLALSRARIGFQHWGRLGAPAQEAVASDIRVALYSERGARWIAERYTFEEERRSLITAIVEAADPRLQRSFLSAVRRVQGGGN